MSSNDWLTKPDRAALIKMFHREMEILKQENAWKEYVAEHGGSMVRIETLPSGVLHVSEGTKDSYTAREDELEPVLLKKLELLRAVDVGARVADVGTRTGKDSYWIYQGPNPDGPGVELAQFLRFMQEFGHEAQRIWGDTAKFSVSNKEQAAEFKRCLAVYVNVGDDVIIDLANSKWVP